MKYFTVVVPQESGQLPVSRLGDAMRSAGMNPNEVGLTLERFHQLMQVRIDGENAWDGGFHCIRPTLAFNGFCSAWSHQILVGMSIPSAQSWSGTCSDCWACWACVQKRRSEG